MLGIQPARNSEELRQRSPNSTGTVFMQSSSELKCKLAYHMWRPEGSTPHSWPALSSIKNPNSKLFGEQRRSERIRQGSTSGSVGPHSERIRVQHRSELLNSPQLLVMLCTGFFDLLPRPRLQKSISTAEFWSSALSVIRCSTQSESNESGSLSSYHET